MVPATTPNNPQRVFTNSEGKQITIDEKLYNQIFSENVSIPVSSLEVPRERLYNLPKTIPFYERYIVIKEGRETFEEGVDREFDIDKQEPLTKRTYYELIVEKFKQGLPYMIASVKTMCAGDQYEVARYDACKYFEEKKTRSFPTPKRVDCNIIYREDVSAFKFIDGSIPLMIRVTQGLPKACFILGLLHLFGSKEELFKRGDNYRYEKSKDIVQSQEKALAYLELSAQKGLKLAQKFLIEANPSRRSENFPKPIPNVTRFLEEDDLTIHPVKDLTDSNSLDDHNPLLVFLEILEQFKDIDPAARYVDFNYTIGPAQCTKVQDQRCCEILFRVQIESQGKIHEICRRQNRYSFFERQIIEAIIHMEAGLLMMKAALDPRFIHHAKVNSNLFFIVSIFDDWRISYLHKNKEKIRMWEHENDWFKIFGFVRFEFSNNVYDFPSSCFQSVPKVEGCLIS